MWHSESLVAACRIQLPDQGSNLGSIRWKLGILTTGLQEKFHKHIDFYFLHFQGVDVTFIYSTDPNKELPQTYGDFTFH